MQRKIICIISAAAAAISLVSTASAEQLRENGFVYETDYNCVTAYEEDTSVVIVPSRLGSTAITSIAGSTFQNNASIETVYIDEGIYDIGESAFEGSTAAYVDIPSSVTHIWSRAFADCKNLTTVVLASENTKVDPDAFKGVKDVTFCIPCTANEEGMYQMLLEACGWEDNFQLESMHTAFEPLDGETDAFICPSCGEILYNELEPQPLMPFEDIAWGAWYYDYVMESWQAGIINGKSETAFDPDANMTIAEAVKIAACLHSSIHGYPDPTGYASEKDTNWYDPYISYCYSFGIIEDYVSFDWTKNATRGEMAYLFARASDTIDQINPDVPLTDIPDVYDTTPYAYEILDLFRRGIVAGSDAKYTYHPDSDIKRSEVSAITARILNPYYRIELPKG